MTRRNYQKLLIKHFSRIQLNNHRKLLHRVSIWFRKCIKEHRGKALRSITSKSSSNRNLKSSSSHRKLGKLQSRKRGRATRLWSLRNHSRSRKVVSSRLIVSNGMIRKMKLWRSIWNSRVLNILILKTSLVVTLGTIYLLIRTMCTLSKHIYKNRTVPPHKDFKVKLLGKVKRLYTMA